MRHDTYVNFCSFRKTDKRYSCPRTPLATSQNFPDIVLIEEKLKTVKYSPSVAWVWLVVGFDRSSCGRDRRRCTSSVPCRPDATTALTWRHNSRIPVPLQRNKNFRVKIDTHHPAKTVLLIFLFGQRFIFLSPFVQFNHFTFRSFCFETF